MSFLWQQKTIQKRPSNTHQIWSPARIEGYGISLWTRHQLHKFSADGKIGLLDNGDSHDDDGDDTFWGLLIVNYGCWLLFMMNPSNIRWYLFVYFFIYRFAYIHNLWLWWRWRNPTNTQSVQENDKPPTATVLPTDPPASYRTLWVGP